jgi:hypothetical protein
MWAKKLIEKKPFKLVAVALANKMARIAFQTDGHRGLTPSGRGIHQNLSGGRFAVRS